MYVYQRVSRLVSIEMNGVEKACKTPRLQDILEEHSTITQTLWQSPLLET